MYRPAHAARVQEVATRLERYFADAGDNLLVSVRYLDRQGNYIAVSLPESPALGIMFHVDELDNGASGFKDAALLRIQAYRDGTPYVPPTVDPRLVYDDVMTMTGEIGVAGEVPLG